MNHDPFGVIESDAYTYPPQVGEPICASEDCMEIYTVHLPIRAEEDIRIDYAGECQCDKCRSEEHEAVELYRGMSVALLDGKQIYIGCLQEYLEDRMLVIGR